MFKCYLKKNLVGPRGCTHFTSGPLDTAPYAPESDSFKHHVRT